MKFLLRCPKCSHHMLYETRDTILTGKRKACVYCGRNFSVRNQIIERK